MAEGTTKTPKDGAVRGGASGGGATGVARRERKPSAGADAGRSPWWRRVAVPRVVVDSALVSALGVLTAVVAAAVLCKAFVAAVESGWGPQLGTLILSAVMLFAFGRIGVCGSDSCPCREG